ncbi:MAG: hypothetical protein RLZZ200_2216, partial [Pseudomonadota bacterium]
MQGGGLTTRNAWFYASGEFGSALTWNMFSAFILYYYTNVALLPAAAVGTLLLVSRVFDAVLDPVIGLLVDRTKTRWGKARPYLVLGVLPFSVLFVLSFTVMGDSTESRMVYAWVTFMLAGILYSLFYIPYNALMPLITSDGRDKIRLGSMRSMAASAGSLAMYATVTALIASLGGGSEQLGYTLTSGVMAAANAISILLVFFWVKERHFPAEVATGNLRDGLRGMFSNPVWLLMSGVGLLLFIRLGAMVSATA